MAISVDMMELDGKATPAALAAEIFRQNPNASIPIAVDEVADAVGIINIESLSTTGFEGMLISNPEKSEGVIFFNQNQSPRRRRFTVGHELGHFLLPWHRNLLDGSMKFECTAEDMRSQGMVKSGSRADWEIQANEFASELLLPRQQFKKRMKHFGEPEMQHISDLSEIFDMSVEATARRYVALSDHSIAMIFALDSKIRHAWKSPEFNYFLDVKKGDSLPRESQSSLNGEAETILGADYIDSHWWINADRGRNPPEQILEQTLFQRDGYRIVMLYAEAVEDADEE